MAIGNIPGLAENLYRPASRAPAMYRERSQKAIAALTAGDGAKTSTALDKKVVEKVNEFIYGSFFKMMMKAMRKTAPTDSMFGGGYGEEVFTEFYDDIVSKEFARSMPDTYGRIAAEQLVRKATQPVAPRLDVKG
mgnify:CR=1 FL=1